MVCLPALFLVALPPTAIWLLRRYSARWRRLRLTWTALSVWGMSLLPAAMTVVAAVAPVVIGLAQAAAGAGMDDVPYGALIVETAGRYELDPMLLRAVVEVESDFDPAAFSPAGAMGLGQLMPVMVQACDLADPFEPAGNLDCSARFLAYLMQKYRDNLDLALAAYNAGEPRVDACGCVPGNWAYVGMVKAAYERPGQADYSLPYRGFTPRLVGNGLHGDGQWPGRDWATACGTPLYAPLTGWVARTGRDAYQGPFGRGNTFALFTDGVTEVMMMHGDYLVEADERVVQGVTLVGYEASNGNSSECHTHFSVRVGGVLVDPLEK